ncbi:hypothetical protein BJX61DRAFT_500881, partial [Aspergillus egyptiacus]
IYRLGHSNSGVRQAAVEALGTQSSWPPEILHAVTLRLDNSDRGVSQAAVKALGTQSPWPPETFHAVTCRLGHSDLGMRWATVTALGTQLSWPPETLHAVICRLDDSNYYMRQAAVEALAVQSSWPPDTLHAVTRRLHNNSHDWNLASKIEGLLWQHKDFLSPILSLYPDATSALCKIWVQRSIHEFFACYVFDGNIYFETSDGRRSWPLSKAETKLLRNALHFAPSNSPILRLVYERGTLFGGVGT